MQGVTYAPGSSARISSGKKNFRIIGHPEGSRVWGFGTEATWNLSIGTAIYQYDGEITVSDVPELNKVVLDDWPEWAEAGNWLYFGYDRFDQNNQATYGTGPFESHAGDPNNVRRRIYGEILQIASVDKDNLTIAFTRDLYRKNYTTTGLRVRGCTNQLYENISIENVTFKGNRYETSSGLYIANGINIYLKNVVVDGAAGTGIHLIRCQDSTLEDCKTYRIGSEPTATGLGYGILPDMCHNVLITDSYHYDCRYGVSVSTGSTNITVDGAFADFIATNGMGLDIHGGDSLKIRFKNCFLPQSSIRGGNESWRRGADDFEVDNCETIGFVSVGAVRHFKIKNSRCQYVQYYSVANGDTGNGLMNDTGANLPYVQTPSIQASTISNFSDVPGRRMISFDFAAGGSPSWSDFSITSSTVMQNEPTANPNHALISHQYGTYGAGNHKVSISGTSFFWNPYPSSAPVGNPIKLDNPVGSGTAPAITCTYSWFWLPGTIAIPKLIKVQSASTVFFRCTNYVNDSGETLIAAAGFVDGAASGNVTFDNSDCPA